MSDRIVVKEGDDPWLRVRLIDQLRSMLIPPDGFNRPCWVTASCCDEGGELRGGVIGLVAGLWLTVELLWVLSEHRGKRIGSDLLLAVERKASTLGCIGACVETSSNTARLFYEHLGYLTCLVREQAEPGYAQYMLQKRFNSYN